MEKCGIKALAMRTGCGGSIKRFEFLKDLRFPEPTGFRDTTKGLSFDWQRRV